MSEPMTHEQVLEMNRPRYNRVLIDEMFRSQMAELQVVFEDFTCAACPHTDTCEFAWDLYNTGGDCLAIK